MKIDWTNKDSWWRYAGGATATQTICRLEKALAREFFADRDGTVTGLGRLFLGIGAVGLMSRWGIMNGTCKARDLAEMIVLDPCGHLVLDDMERYLNRRLAGRYLN